jgi:hypothetical protein
LQHCSRRSIQGPAVLTTLTDKDGKKIIAGRKVTGFTCVCPASDRDLHLTPSPSNAEEEQVGLTKAVPWLLEDRLQEVGGKYEKAAEPVRRPQLSI